MGDTWRDPEGPTLSPDPTGEVPAAEADPVRYHLGTPLGAGGMGEVWSATDRALRREVAVKMLRVDDPIARDRFVAEAQVTAQLQHPNIIPVHDLGRLPDGRPFLAMKQVRGDPLHVWVRRTPPPPLDHRLDVFRKVCEAVAYANEHGVLHRDIKPANLMVGSFGEVLVMDWGLARPIGAAEGPTSDEAIRVDRFERPESRSLDGHVAGTPNYMAPEQAEGRVAGLDARADVYALGAVLYELVTGRQAFEGGVEAILLDVRAGRFPRPRARAHGVPRELEAVILKAMALHPADRYPTAAALKEDIDAFLARRPMVHVSSSWWERGTKWAARHRGAVRAATAVGAAAGLLLLAGAWRYSADVGAARDAAVAEAGRARTAEAEARLALGRANLALADAHHADGLHVEAEAALDAALAAFPAGGPEARAVDLARSVLAADSAPPLGTCERPGAVVALAVTPDGTTVAGLHADGTVATWDPVGCRGGEAVDLGGAVSAGALRLGAGGPEVVAVVGDQLVHAAGGAQVTVELGPAAPIHAVGLGEDGDAWAVGRDGRGWRLPRGGATLVADGAPQADGAWWVPDGDLRVVDSVRTGSEAGGAWPRAGGRARWSDAGVNAGDADTEGRFLLAASSRGVSWVDLERGSPAWERDLDPVARAQVAPGDRFGVVAHFDGRLRVMDLADGTTAAALGGLGAVPRTLATSTGARVVVAGLGSTTRAWLRPARPTRRVPAGLSAGAQGLALSPDDRLVAAADDTGRVVLADRATRGLVRAWTEPGGAVRALAFSPEGDQLAVARWDGTVALVSVATGRRTTELRLPARVLSLAWPGPLLAGSREGAVHEIGGDGVLRRTLPVLAGAIWDLSPSPDGRAVLVAGHGASSNPVVLLDLGTGQPTTVDPAGLSRYRHALGPDGRLAVVGQQDGRLRFYDLAGGAPPVEVPDDDGPTLGVDLSPDGTLLATTGFGRRVVLWDPARRERLREIDQHGGLGAAVLFTHDGRQVVSVGDDDDVGLLPLDRHRVWAEALARLRAGPGPGRAAAWAALDGWEWVEAAVDPADDPAEAARLVAQARFALRAPPVDPTPADPYLAALAGAER